MLDAAYRNEGNLHSSGSIEHEVLPQTAVISRFIYCQNITAKDFMVEYIDGDAVVVTNSKWVDIDASSFDE